MDEGTIAGLVGQQAEIEGTARDAMLGAVVLLEDRTPVYLDGLERWDDKAHGQQVRVKGVLRHRGVAPQAGTDEDGGVSHGQAGPSYVLESWSVAS